jgi:Viral BACON domain
MRCPKCQESLPEAARYCAKCGENLSTPEQDPNQSYENQADSTIKLAHHPTALEVDRFNGDDKNANVITQHAESRITPTSAEVMHDGLILDDDFITTPDQIDDQQQDIDDFERQRRATWNKTVTYKSPRIPPGPVTPIPPTLPAPGASMRLTLPALIGKKPPKGPRHIPTQLFSWISILVIVGLSLGGVFGLAATFSRQILSQSSHNSHVLSLQVTPSTVALGGTITLRGSGFSSSAQVGLTRDTNIQVFDTSGKHIIHADNGGFFSDTVLVDQIWGAGQHTVSAEDAISHKSATFTVIVTGQSSSLRPAHLLFKPDIIDLGSGDLTTNSTQVITLSNTGSGQISWQATATRQWLLISPKSGTFSNGQDMQVAIAADRSNLKVGNYAASVIFTSTIGPTSPLAVKMTVTPLQPGHEAALQLTPAALSFTGTDGSVSPPDQVVTVSNPGVLPLEWNASSSTSDGSSWLSVYPQFGTVTRGSSQAVTIGVNISTLLPGVYSGFVTFTSQGSFATRGSPQTIYVSLNILPQCEVQVSPGGLTFAGVYLQTSPAPKTINVGVSQGCSSTLHWSAAITTSSGGNWLHMGRTSGVTPTNPSVSVNTAGLTPGTYTGSLIFSWPGGTQTVPVTFVMGQPTTPIEAATPATMLFNGVAGQPDPASQTATITNTGSGTLTWNAAAATTAGGGWLAITPATGALTSQQSATITVTVSLLNSLTAGTYTGAITITGTDSTGRPAAGSPQSIPVTFVVLAPCTIAATPPALSFQGVIGQAAPVAQTASISASEACANALNWTATTATTPAGGTWLSATPASGSVGLKAPSSTSIGVALTGLAAGTYTGTVTISAIDSVTNNVVGTPQIISVTLTVQPVCTLQGSSVAGETFTTEAGTNPAAQTFTIGFTGACTGNVTITPTVTLASGTGWLAVTPASATVASGGSATFTVTVTSASLATGQYTGSISLAAVNGGITITGSPQTVGVTLQVVAPPGLTAGPPNLSFNSAGAQTQQVTINNTGGEPLNWTAALATGAPSFVSLSAGSGTNLVGGTSTSISVNVNAAGVPGGSSFQTSVIVSAVDPITGLAVTGSPSTVSLTINISPPPMSLSLSNLAFTTTVGNNPAAQNITIQNTGGGTLTWTAGTPSQPWLTVTPTSGSDAGSQSSQIAFNVDVTGMTAGTYHATVRIIPTPGTAVKVKITLTIN